MELPPNFGNPTEVRSVPVHLFRGEDGTTGFMFNVVPLMTPQASISNPLALQGLTYPESVNCGDRFDNLTLICKEGQKIKVDRAIFCRISKAFLDLFGDPNVKSFEMKETPAYVIHKLVDILELRLRISDIPHEHLAAFFVFADIYQSEWLKNSLKSEMMNSTIFQVHFNLDERFKLGMRKHLLQEVYLDYVNPSDHHFTDPKIYQEIGNFIFKVPCRTVEERLLLHRRQFHFAKNFIRSGFLFSDYEFDLTGAPVPVALLILMPIRMTAYVNHWLLSGKLSPHDEGLEKIKEIILNGSNAIIADAKRRNASAPNNDAKKAKPDQKE